MELDAEQIIFNAVRDGLREGVKGKLACGYNDPLNTIINQCVTAHGEDFRKMLGDALQSCIGDPAFQQEMRESVRHVLAKTLVARFGGELEKQVNALKSDPATRARITVAIEDIVKSKTS
jgi:hypothetical protein